MADELIHKCSVCSCDYTDDEGGVQGNFGILPVSFCPTCFSCMCDMAQYYNEPDEPEEEIKPEHAEFLQHLRGVTRIVINKQHGGFSLSHRATIAYLEMIDTPYELRPQPDRHSQDRYGSDVYVNGEYFHDRLIPRDDPALVAVVKKLGEAASGKYADLTVVMIPGDVDWEIEEYDGLEWVAEKHRIWR